jgi:glycerophosphoryl diester phosphodiesterase
MSILKKQIYVWTVNDERQIETLLKLGVEGIITDQPLLALNIQKQLTSSS